MHHHQQNRTTSTFLKKILIIVSLVCYLAPTAYAAEPPLSCSDIGKGEKEKAWIVTILEEEIGSGASNEDLQVFSCIRKTTCKKSTEGEGEKAKEVTKCEDPVYVQLGDCSPGPMEFCQRVQVLVAQSGVDLLMQYIGIIYRWAASVIGIISVIYLVWGGFMITTAQDSTEAIGKAKEKIMQSIAGLVLLFLSAVILYTINPNFFTL